MTRIEVCGLIARARSILGAMVFVIAGAIVWAGSAAAQADRVWVQIESHASLTTAEQRARAYAQVVENVNGFRATTGLYALALGPYDTATARNVLQTLLAQGIVPGDSFIEDGDLYAAAFFPIGSTALTDTAPVATDGAQTIEATEAAETGVVEIAPELQGIPEETQQEARRSEAQLDRPAREQLQIAMEWFGFYNAGIDGAFGPGTRNGMRLYQESIGVEPTGILTTRQRARLLRDYTAELDAIGMRTVRDEAAGIEIDLPLAMVAFSRHNFPFAQFDAINDSGVQVLLISQPGDRATLFGLYEIMQTLEIVPLEGERERGRDSFVLTGQSDTLRSHTEARLVGGAVKGFTLVWTPERDDQMARVLPMMQATIEYFDGSLDPAAVPEGIEDGVDMVSGLDIRQPDLVRSGFFVDDAGTVLTTTDITMGACEAVLINDIYEAEIAFEDAALGLAVLRPNQRLAPLAYAQLAPTPGRVRSEIAVSAFPFGGALSSASMSFGELSDLQGINGETTIQRLSLRTSETEAGGPVLDLAGTVLGMVIPGNVEGRSLPADVTLALRADQLADVLTAAGVVTTVSDRRGAMNRENLARYGADMTVTVSCWN